MCCFLYFYMVLDCFWLLFIRTLYDILLHVWYLHSPMLVCFSIIISTISYAQIIYTKIVRYFAACTISLFYDAHLFYISMHKLFIWRLYDILLHVWYRCSMKLACSIIICTIFSAQVIYTKMVKYFAIYIYVRYLFCHVRILSGNFGLRYLLFTMHKLFFKKIV